MFYCTIAILIFGYYIATVKMEPAINKNFTVLAVGIPCDFIFSRFYCTPNIFIGRPKYIICSINISMMLKSKILFFKYPIVMKDFLLYLCIISLVEF